MISCAAVRVDSKVKSQAWVSKGSMMRSESQSSCVRICDFQLARPSASTVTGRSVRS